MRGHMARPEDSESRLTIMVMVSVQAAGWSTSLKSLDKPASGSDDHCEAKAGP